MNIFMVKTTVHGFVIIWIRNVATDMFLALDKDANGTLSKQELREYADGTLTEIFIERGKFGTNFLCDAMNAE